MTAAIDVLTPAAQPGSWRISTESGTAYTLTSDYGKLSVVRSDDVTPMRGGGRPLRLLHVSAVVDRGQTQHDVVRVGLPMRMLLEPLAAGVAATIRTSTPVVSIVEL